MSEPSKTAVILVDHGSARVEANELIEQLAERLRRDRPGTPVYVSHMDMAEPTIADAFARAAADGATRIVVHPYFLGPGRHSRLDIPRMVKQAAAAHPTVRAVVTEPLGLDELMTRLVWKRIDAAVGLQD